MSLYPDIQPFKTGHLKLSDGHTMYYEQSGNPKGVPVLMLHGGPGGGISDKHRRSADPIRCHIIAFDQRGCGKSKPLGRLQNNTAHHLVADIEKLRHHLGIQSWIVMGYSWGCALGLAYAEAYPSRVLGLVVCGAYLGTSRENAWFEGPNGVARFHPVAYRQMCESVGAPDGKHVMAKLLKTLQGKDKTKAKNACSAWSRYALACCEPVPNLMEIEEAVTPTPAAMAMNLVGAHYHSQGCFLAPNQLLNNISKIAHIPLHIVQGALDMVCPPESALALHAAHPISRLYWVELCGHRANAAGQKARVKAVKDMLRKISG
ncbi:MAG: prolyl aminopeptidase [Alphaproteobacteria bacterium]